MTVDALSAATRSRGALRLQFAIHPGPAARMACAGMLVMIFSLASVPAALAQTTQYWDINGSTIGSGGPTPAGIWDSSTTNWSTSAFGNTTTAAFNNASNANVVFSAGNDATGSYTVTVNGNLNVASITFNSGTPTLAAGIGGNAAH